jgi:hypothetical protein
LAPDANRLRELEQAVRQYLAWNSIWSERVPLNLDQFQTRQAETKRESTDEAVELRIKETYYWLLVPGQPDPKGEIEWTDLKAQGDGSLAARAAKKLKNEECLLLLMGGVRLRTELDRVPLWNSTHVGIKQLADYMARYLYLPRLRDEQVLVGAIQEGVASLVWQDETFAYAEGYDEARQRYQGLKCGAQIRVIIDDRSLLVKPSAAIAQLDSDRQAAENEQQRARPIGQGENGSSGPAGGGPKAVVPPGGAQAALEPPKLSRFHASVQVDPQRLGRDASRIAEEVVQHLTTMLGAEVEIALEIQARLPEGASDKLVRDVTENCRTLKFTDYGFEEE